MPDTTWTQDRHLLAIESSLGKDKLLLTSLDGHEGLSELFSYEVEMLSTDHSISAERLIGDKVKIVITAEDGHPHVIHGMIAQWRAGPVTNRDWRHYRAEIVPWFWYLGHSTDCRIFQNLNVPEIIEQVFQTFGFSDFEMAVSRGDYPKLEFCVQYRETALNFVSRLMEEVGIFYYFRHEESRHVMVISDKNASFKTLPELELIYESSNPLRASHVTRWEHTYEFRPGRWAQRDFNFETPSGDLTTNEKTVLKLRTAPAFERYDYPGRYVQKGRGTQLTKTLMEAEEAAYHAVRGASTYHTLDTGRRFRLTHHPCESQSSIYVIRRIRRTATDTSHQTQAEREPCRYSNSFEAIPFDVPFRPARVTEKPFVHGPQTAIVVGPAGEQIYTDKYGRVRVQFHWDRYGKRDDKSSCWIRVSHAWAGRGWGSVHLPHVGHEVIVSFLEGDPDCPLVTGRVYNGENQKTMSMPANKTQSGLKDHSGNEILMEGKAGSEDIRVHAVKDMHVVVDHDRDDHVRHDRSYTVDGISTETVIGKVTETYQDEQETRVTKKITIVSGTSNILVEAATDITLHVGASKLAMYADGRIELSGKAIAITGSDAVNVSGMSIKEEATNDHSISGMIVMSSGSVSNTVKGAMVMLNP
jgi:type VI secretion system secreted protein VgrG